MCKSQQNTGYSVNGGFAEYVLADPDYVGHLPDNVDFIDIAPILCAGVTVYKGLKVTDTKPGDWVVISGVGGLGHVAVQYAAAMGLNVLAVDVDDQKLELAKRLGATLAVNARTTDPVAYVQNEIGGAQGVLVTAVSPKAFEQAMHMADGAAPLCSTAFPRATSRCRSSTPCSTVRRCAARSWGRAWISRRRDFAGQGKVKATITTDRLENINDVFEQMKAGKIEGRIVLDFH